MLIDHDFHIAHPTKYGYNKWVAFDKTSNKKLSDNDNFENCTLMCLWADNVLDYENPLDCDRVAIPGCKNLLHLTRDEFNGDIEEV